MSKIIDVPWTWTGTFHQDNYKSSNMAKDKCKLK